MEFASKEDEDNAKMRLLTHKLMIEDQFMSFADENISDFLNLPQIDTAVATSNTPSSDQGLTMIKDGGGLGALPVEIIVDILEQVDLKTLLKLRLTSRYIKQIIDHSMIHYRNVIKYAPRALIALHRTGMAAHVSTRKLLRVLYTTLCFNCKKYAPLLNMLTFTRCCYPCLTKSPLLDPITRRTAKYKYGLDNKTVQSLPALKSLPGRYSYFRNVYKRRLNLINEELAIVEGAARVGGYQALKAAMGPDIHAQWPHGPRQNPHTGHPRRFMTAVPFPSFNPRSQVLESFVCCIGCSHYITNRHQFLMNHTAFSKHGFLQHFQHCQEARKIWATYAAKKRALPLGYVVKT